MPQYLPGDLLWILLWIPESMDPGDAFLKTELGLKALFSSARSHKSALKHLLLNKDPGCSLLIATSGRKEASWIK